MSSWILKATAQCLCWLNKNTHQTSFDVVKTPLDTLLTQAGESSVDKILLSLCLMSGKKINIYQDKSFHAIFHIIFSIFQWNMDMEMSACMSSEHSILWFSLEPVHQVFQTVSKIMFQNRKAYSYLLNCQQNIMNLLIDYWLIEFNFLILSGTLKWVILQLPVFADKASRSPFTALFELLKPLFHGKWEHTYFESQAWCEQHTVPPLFLVRPQVMRCNEILFECSLHKWFHEIFMSFLERANSMFAIGLKIK